MTTPIAVKKAKIYENSIDEIKARCPHEADGKILYHQFRLGSDRSIILYILDLR